jgi:hypothetical protein
VFRPESQAPRAEAAAHAPGGAPGAVVIAEPVRGGTSVTPVPGSIVRHEGGALPRRPQSPDATPISHDPVAGPHPSGPVAVAPHGMPPRVTPLAPWMPSGAATPAGTHLGVHPGRAPSNDAAPVTVAPPTRPPDAGADVARLSPEEAERRLAFAVSRAAELERSMRTLKAELQAIQERVNALMAAVQELTSLKP